MRAPTLKAVNADPVAYFVIDQKIQIVPNETADCES
jgi:hypothetical protein